MQELGAFDIESPVLATPTPSATRPSEPARAASADIRVAADALSPERAETAAPAAGPSGTAAASPQAPRGRPTKEQLRDALAKADPGTRSKLLRLITGGRPVEHVDTKANGRSHGVHPLTIRLNQTQPDSTRSPHHAAPGVNRPQPRAAGPARGAANAASFARHSGQAGAGGSADTLLRIDADTELLDAVPPPPSAEQRKAALQAQLETARSQEAPPRGEAASAHKVLFPAYDPRQHGDDVRRPTRRADAPVEGHFPAPRQPFKPSYKHVDGRPMNEEETKVEVVLQEQRCEQTLAVLARDGVNGLLLSPRDLDAAVDNGTLDAPTAALLWKTWSALRPVIHVIDDQPAAQPEEESAPGDEAPAVEADADPVLQLEQAVVAAPAADRPEVLPEEPQAGAAAAAVALPLPELAEPALPAAAAAGSLPAEPAAEATSSAADSMPPPLIAAYPGTSAAPEPPLATREQRAVGLGRLLLRVLVGLCVMQSAAQFALWSWHRWGHWLLA